MSKKFSLLLIALLVIVPLTMAACGSDDKKSDTKSVDLTQTFESTSGLTVKYPDGWAAKDGSSGLEIANSQTALDSMDDSSITAIPAGTAGVLVMAAPLEALGLAADASMKDVADLMASAMGSGENATIGDTSDLKVNGHDGARVDISSDTDSSEGFMLAYKIDDSTVVIVAVVAHKGELSQYEATALKIVDSITYTAPAAPAG